LAPFALDGGAAARWARERIASRASAPIAAPIGVRGFRATPLNAADIVEVPAMGDSITEGSIAAVLKGPGDAVEVDEVIAQIETDKVTIDVRAPAAGVVVDVLVKEGDSVTVGQGVCTVEAGAASASKKGKKASKAAAPEAAGPPTDIEVPQMGDSITEGAVAALTKSPGDAVEVDEVIAQIETDKVTIDVRAPAAGVLDAYKVGEGDTVTVGQALATFTPGGVGAPAKAAAAPAAAAPAAPAAPAAAPAAAPSPPPASAPALGERRETRVKMTRLRLRVSERLKSAQNTYAMLTTFNEIDMSGLMSMRSQFKDAFLETHGAKLGFMSCFVKASARALKAVPAVNAIIDGDEIVYREFYDVSIAVSAPKGLVVPVLRDVDRLSFAGVEGAIASYGKKAKDGTLAIDEMTGGTFTISNGGVFGSLNGTPIINPPQSAILGMHSIVNRPVVVNGEIVIRPMMNVALTYDHRLVDGREAVTFLKTIKEAVEDPRRLLLDL
jgi:2-oxoglutarate dehydrogenase E2 component (dihydrolipoamide succinyltransferase)